MTSAAQLGWGSGWPNCPTANVVTAICGSQSIRLPVRREIVPLVAGLVIELERSRRRELGQYGCWGFACRPISGTRIPSNHSQACAVDLDAPNNPHASAATHAAPHPLRKWFPSQGRYLRTTMPLDAEFIARKWGFAWGGLYPSRPDTMHFEINVTPAQAARLIADLRALDGRPVPPEVVPAPTSTQPKFLEGEEDMLVVEYAGGRYLVVGNRLVHLATARDIDTLKFTAAAVGRPVQEWPVSRDQWRRLVAMFGRPWTADGKQDPEPFFDGWAGADRTQA